MGRKNISISSPVEQRAQEIIQARGFSGLSDMIAVLIREEYERRQAPKVDALNDAPSRSRSADDADETPSAHLLRAGAADARAAAAPGADTPVLYPGPRKAASTRRRPAPGQVASKPSTSHEEKK